jgi:hypothetical protein
MRGEATAWSATCVAPAANGAPRAVCRPVDWRHLARSTCHGRHGGGGVRPRADVVARDVVAERAPVFQGVFNSLNQFSNAIFSKF